MKVSSCTCVEPSVSNLSEVITLADASLQHAQETAKEVQLLQFAVERNKDQLTSVSEALKQLSVIDSLSRRVATIRCSLDHILNNSSGAAGCCPPDWTAFESSCYYFSHMLLTWNESRGWCETRRAPLVILHSDMEWDFVTHRTIPERFWIGLSDWRTGSWDWEDQTAYTEPRQWKPGQADDRSDPDLGPVSEDCAVLDSDGQLNDLYCSLKRRFICQKDEFKEP